MSILVNLPEQEVAALRQLTRLENDAEAVKRAVQEFLRLSRLRELKAVSGKVEFQDNWRELEELELAETDFPK
jgi:hypothetical protein